MKLRQTILMLLTVCAAIPASAQQFFHLTADELRVDTLSAPQFTHVMPLPEAWRDSVYTCLLYTS